MAISKFTIVNSDGTINKSEYERCISFINQYIEGTVKVYPETTWENPLEVDMSQDKSAFEMIGDLISLSSNRLLTNKAYNHIKNLFKGLLERYGAGIYTTGYYLPRSGNFLDGPGYMYDVLGDEKSEVKRKQLDQDLAVYYINDDYKTVVQYEDRNYQSVADATSILWNNPSQALVPTTHYQSNIDSYPNVYKGYVSGVYTPFMVLSGQYVGSSTLFFYSEDNDILYTSGLDAYNDSRINETINTKKFVNSTYSTKPSRGVDMSLITTAQTSVTNAQNANAYLRPSYVNTLIPYTNPILMTVAEPTEWIFEDEA